MITILADDQSPTISLSRSELDAGMIGPKRPLCDAALVAQMQEVAAHLRLTEIAGRALIVGGKAENAADIGGLGVRREAGREPCRRSYAYAGVSSWWSFSRIAPAYAGHTRLPRRPIHAPDGERHLRRSRSVQSILWPAGHSFESTVRYLGVEVDDALDIAEKIEV